MLASDPYQAQAGPELDAIIHARIMKLPARTPTCPAYSSMEKEAKRVLSQMKENRRAVMVGRTGLEGRTWFARFETNSMDGTEVFAESFALAICRLALLHAEELDADKRG